MNMKEKITKYLMSIGIEKSGVAKHGKYSAVVCLFPYFVEKENGNLSLYARSVDYHKIISEKLRIGACFIESMGVNVKGCFCDIGEGIERQLAYEAGLGFYGDNSMLINEKYGSFFFIGYILCDFPLEADKPLEKQCIHCGECRKKCPGNALDKGFDKNRCASYISQKKGDLTNDEKEILKKAGSIFGCDICQIVCPYNNGKKNAINEFCTDRINSISREDICNLSGKEFLRKYKNRAFSWRGKSVIERNLDILDKDF